MVSRPHHGGPRRRAISGWLVAGLSFWRRVSRPGAGGRSGSERSAGPSKQRWREAQRSGALDGLLIAAVFVLGVAAALVMTLF
jgi:hypothetical protein